MNASSSAKHHPLSVLPIILLALAAAVMLFPAVGSAQLRSTVGGYEVSGPYHHKNMSVFLIHGKGTLSGRNIVTLEEGLEQGIVRVYETGSVNELAIENLSNDVEVYIQAGDIVKGGQQDRTLGIDLTLVPNSGRVPIASFCVERGRWTQRGEEPSGEFTSSNAAVTSNELRLAIKESKNQSEVWENVDVMQTKLSENVGVPVNALGAAGAPGSDRSVILTANVNIALDALDVRTIQNETIVAADTASDGVTVSDVIGTAEILDHIIYEDDSYQSAALTPHYGALSQGNVLQSRTATFNHGSVGAYTTSLQLSLENAELIDEVEEYMAALRGIVAAHDDVIGFAFTINGDMRNADVYASGDLFERLWPKLLRAAATEAVSEQNNAGESPIGSINAVRKCFLDAEAAAGEEEEIDERMIMVTRRTEENILFETQEKGEEEWLHRNYMKLEFE